MSKIRYAFIALFFISNTTNSNLTFENSWIREAPLNSKKMSAYGTLKNDSMSSFKLIRIEASGFKKIQMHQSELNEETIMMKKIENLIIEANSSIELSPGGKHIMLHSPVKYFNTGDSIELFFFFESDYEEKVIRVNFPVKREGP